MRAKRWGVFFCNCRSTLEVDAARIESSAALVTVASQPGLSPCGLSSTFRPCFSTQES